MPLEKSDCVNTSNKRLLLIPFITVGKQESCYALIANNGRRANLGKVRQLLKTPETPLNR